MGVGKKLQREEIYIYIYIYIYIHIYIHILRTDPHCCTAESNTTL